MNPKRSLRYKLIVGFVTIALPLVCLLLYSNYMASNSVREQAAESNRSMIALYSNQIQTALAIETNYLYDLASNDVDILSLGKLEGSSSDYTLTKVRILHSLDRYNRFDSSVDTQFAYSVAHRDFIPTQIPGENYDEMLQIRQCLERRLKDAQPGSPYFTQWKATSCGDTYGLMRIVDSGSGVYLGAWVRLDHLMVPLELIQLGREGFAAFASAEGRLLTGTAANKGLTGSSVIDSAAPYQRMTGKEDTYIVVSHPVASTDVELAAFIPEQGMLQNLSRFREFISWIPIFVVVLLSLYLLYLNQIIIRPVNELLKGMRTLKRGDWEFRLTGSPSKEFHLVNESFNDMVQQIQTLQIHVYEEQIRTHKAELKHLQLQINPHFLLNSINVVYNLAQIKNYSVIQAMCLNLVKYFRFATKTGQPFVALAEEMEHMDSYLRIQQLRFPGRITFRIEMEGNVGEFPIPPLVVQPFIENAVKHGFDFMDEPFHIEIRARLEEGGCRIRIADNGSGFPEEVLAELQSGSYFMRNDDLHLGMRNSYHRLHLLYGSGAGLSFGNGRDSGAWVELEIPAENKEQVEWLTSRSG